MDPVTLVVAALSAGVAAGADDAATSAVKDAYAGLRALVVRRLTGHVKAEETLAEFEGDQDTYEKPLAKELVAAGADRDEEIRQAAEELLRQADAAGVRTKYQVQVQNGGKVGIIGDHAHVDRMDL